MFHRARCVQHLTEADLDAQFLQRPRERHHVRQGSFATRRRNATDCGGNGFRGHFHDCQLTISGDTLSSASRFSCRLSTCSRKWCKSSRYLNTQPMVSTTVLSSKFLRLSAIKAEAQSRVSATPGRL